MAGKRKGTDDERYLWEEMLRAIREIKPKYVIAENVFGITNIDGGLVFEQVCLDLEAEGYEVQPFIIPAAAKNAPHRRDRVWFVAYCNSNGFNERNGNDEVNTSQRGEYEQRNFEQIHNEQPITEHTNGISNRGMSEQSSAAYKQRRSSKADKKIGINWEQQSLCNIASEGNATDTTSTGRGQNNRIRKSRLNNQTGKRNDWHNFPTQSPICSGNDGFSNRLDGITFSKWRAESIKGYGNAIVPQIAYSLFEIIQELNENLQQM
jgi:DNA (cytosine-5)-methyltransferase 1